MSSCGSHNNLFLVSTILSKGNMVKRVAGTNLRKIENYKKPATTF